jgi:hypothetical protein
MFFTKSRMAFMTSNDIAKRIVWLQLLWAVLAAAWNVAGVFLIANGARSLGPTASLLGATVLIAIGVGLFSTYNRSAIIYVALSVVSAAMAGLAVYNALTADPSLWPSEFWRYAGIILNAAGAFAGAGAIINLLTARTE